MKYSDIYIMGDQPTTCPLCGVRTEIIQEWKEDCGTNQYHQCPPGKCRYTFMVVENWLKVEVSHSRQSPRSVSSWTCFRICPGLAPTLFLIARGQRGAQETGAEHIDRGSWNKFRMTLRMGLLLSWWLPWLKILGFRFAVPLIKVVTRSVTAIKKLLPWN